MRYPKSFYKDLYKFAGQAEDEAAQAAVPQGEVPQEGMAPPPDPVQEENAKLQTLLENAELKMSLLNASKEYDEAKKAIREKAAEPLPEVDIHTGLAKEVVQHQPEKSDPIKNRRKDELEARQETDQQDKAQAQATPANDKS